MCINNLIVLDPNVKPVNLRPAAHQNISFQQVNRRRSVKCNRLPQEAVWWFGTKLTETHPSPASRRRKLLPLQILGASFSNSGGLSQRWWNQLRNTHAAAGSGSAEMENVYWNGQRHLNVWMKSTFPPPFSFFFLAADVLGFGGFESWWFYLSSNQRDTAATQRRL